MSKPRYKWWGFAKAVIRAYPAHCDDLKAMREQGITPAYSAAGHGSEVHRTAATDRDERVYRRRENHTDDIEGVPRRRRAHEADRHGVFSQDAYASRRGAGVQHQLWHG